MPVIFHDTHIDTTTDVAKKFPGRQRADGRFYALDFTVAELKQLNVTERFNPKTGKAAFPKRFPVGVGSFQVVTLEEEIQFIQSLNRSTGRNVGIYPELKAPAWHRQEGRDLSAAVLPLLRKYGYDAKDSACYVQCFEYAEIRRLRGELVWKGKLIMLLGGKGKGPGETDFTYLQTDAGLAELAQLVDGIVEVKRRHLPSHFTDEILNRSPSPESQASISGASGCLPGLTRKTAWLSSDPQVPYGASLMAAVWQSRRAPSRPRR